ncbi:hypothetical protein [uncultured Shimia sp.]|uniref:hypothetical protein n=1 Tax=uncultured Shimia sp. TaxID=573152 RepID=UPI0026314F17|nr:hypothetical protein [uncultured Shimia sp.]
MNDDLYGHALNKGEQVSYAQLPSGVGLPVRLILLILIIWFVVPELATELGAPQPFRPSPGPVILLLVLLSIVAGIWPALLSRVWFTRPRPALVTTQRVIATNGVDMPLSRISKVHGRWSTIKLDGQKLADGLVIRDMQNAHAFRTAIERHLA